MAKKTKKKTSKFRGKTGQDARRQKTAGSSYGYLLLPKGVSVFKETPGKRAYIDIMPYEVTDPKHPDRNEELEIATVGEQWYKRPFMIHRNVGVDNDAVVCLRSFGKKCPICEHRALRAKEGAGKDDLKLLNAAKRNLYAVIPKKNKDFDEEVHVWDISQFLFQNLLNDELEEDEEYEVFPDLEDGLTLKVRFDSKTIGTSKPFADASRIDFEKRKKPYKESILSKVPNLDGMLTELSYSEMERLFFEIEDEDSSEDGKKGKSKKGKSKKEKSSGMKRKKKDHNDSKGGKKGKCPHGFKFGKDTDKHEECDECKVWDACIEKKEE